MIKLNLGCGNDYMEGWVNIDQYAPHKVDERYDIIKLPYENNTVDEIKAFHVIEHFPWSKGNEALREWYRVLKPGGRIWLETPDFLESCRMYAMGDDKTRYALLGHFFSEGGDTPGQVHYFLFSEPQLKTQMTWAGFKNITRITPSSGYSKQYPPNIFLCVEAFK